MTELITELLGFLKEIISQKKQTKKIWFEKIVEPAMNDMSIIHNNYISSFLHYRDQIESNQACIFETHSVFRTIADDVIKNSSIRDRLYSFYDTTNRQEMGRFVASIGVYFLFSTNCYGCIYNEEIASMIGPNMPRYKFYSELSDIFNTETLSEQEKKEQGVTLVKVTMTHFENYYKGVIYSYTDLKREMALD